MNAREAAFTALLRSLRQEAFISSSLERWQKNESPSSADFALAQEIAFGTARLGITLDFIAAKLSTRGKLSLKQKEKALLRTAIYQHVFMSRVPLYAIVNETIEIAKKTCHRTFAAYLNAMLRRLSDIEISLPEGMSSNELSIRFSYPPFFIDELFCDYGLAETIKILKAGNTPSITMARLRSNPNLKVEDLGRGLTLIPNTCPQMVKLLNSEYLTDVAKSSDLYIQNITPATLISELASRTPPPKQILDLCASPGGKLLAAHDQFPSALLFGNDITEDKICRLRENFTKYNVPATFSLSLGEEFSYPQPFDLIILDVPCSNSGVLNKRPEARFRLTLQALSELKITQMKLIERAVSLLSKDGAIWYLTCSVLKQENEGQIKAACQKFSLTASFSQTILPNVDGQDGGFACLLRPKLH